LRARVGGGRIFEELGGVVEAFEEQREGVLDHRAGAEDGYCGGSVVWHFGWLLAWERISRALCPSTAERAGAVVPRPPRVDLLYLL